jgi:hypothetical protein
LPAELEKQLKDVVTNKYQGDWKAAVSAFVSYKLKDVAKI